MFLRFAFVLAVVAMASSSFAQTLNKPSGDPNRAKKPAGNCTVSGRVVSAADGTPLRSARVGLIQANILRHPAVYATTTDNEGHFEMKQIEAGRYEFFASHIGYLEQRYQAKGAEEGQGAMLSLISSQEIGDVLFRMVRASAITGKVLDDTGEPMMAVNVSVLRKLTEEERENEGPRGKKLEMTSVSVVQTDDRGEYRIFGLEPGEYFVKAAENAESLYMFGQMEEGSDARVLRELGTQYAPLDYPGALQVDQAQAVTLRAGEEMQADFFMHRVKLVEVAGRVIGPDGSPAVGAYVFLSQPGVSDWGGELGRGTDSKGEFSIKGVSPGSYIVSAGTRDKGKLYNTQQKIEVGEAKADSILLTLGAGATIHGRLVAAAGISLPAARTMVRLDSPAVEGEADVAYTEVNKDGSFELDGVADGNYALITTGLEQGWFLKSAHVGSEDVLLKGVQVENGAVAGRLEIVVSSDGAQIEGAVTDSEQNQTLAGVQLRAKPEPETDYNHFLSRRTATDQNGHYLFKDLPPGKYEVSARILPAGPGAPAVKSDPVALTLGDREHHALDIKLTVPKSE
jgi:protocatechuate 3,4-dioxygenase beta subunit